MDYALFSIVSLRRAAFSMLRKRGERWRLKSASVSLHRNVLITRKAYYGLRKIAVRPALFLSHNALNLMINDTGKPVRCSPSTPVGQKGVVEEERGLELILAAKGTEMRSKVGAHSEEAEKAV
jgi:hypothetical protein